MKHITLVLGTARKERASGHVATYLQKKLSETPGLEVSFVDVQEFVTHPRTIPDWENNDETKPWRDIAAKTDGYILIVPEYNHSYPGELKLLLDQDFDVYAGKPVLVCGVSGGGHGGLRVIEHLHQLLNGYKMIVVPAPMRFGSVADFAKKSHEERDEEQGKRFGKSITLFKEYLDR